MTVMPTPFPGYRLPSSVGLLPRKKADWPHGLDLIAPIYLYVMM